MLDMGITLQGATKLMKVGRLLDEEAIIDVCKEIITDYYYLKIEEFDLIIKNGIKGKYGKSYDRFDISVIYEWITAYETSEGSIAISEQKADDFKKEENKGRNISILESEDFRKMVSKDVLEMPVVQTNETEFIDAEGHREMIRRQAATIMQNNPKQENDGTNSIDNSSGNNDGTSSGDSKID